ncbi:MAG: tyrosine-type recombinase/integrase, partial [Endomicrobia bacterium]|nr:tyrosine-type recombinase/integrase [Endomicrobiia bacterium]
MDNTEKRSSRKTGENEFFSETQKIGETEKKEIESFLKYIQAERNFSAHTLRAYETDVSDFALFLRNKEAGFSAVDKHIFREYMGGLNEKKLSKASLTRKFASLRSFYKFLIINNSIEKSPLENMSSPKKEKKVPSFLTEDEMRSLFEIPDLALRDRGMIELLYSCGLRIEELMSLNVKNIDFISNTVTVTGKGNRERIVPIGDTCLAVIKRYLDERRAENL